MFNTVRMARWEALVLETDLRRVLLALGGLGAVQFIPTPSGPDTAPHSAPDSREMQGKFRRLRSLTAELRRALPKGSRSTGSIGRPARVPAESPDAEVALVELEKRVQAWRQQCEVLQRRKNEAMAHADRAAAFSGAELPLRDLAGIHHLHYVCGSVPESTWDRVDPALRAHGHLTRLGRRRGRIHLVAITTPARWPTLEGALQRAGFRAEALPLAGEATPEGEFTRSTAEVERLEVELRRAEAEGIELSELSLAVADQAEALVDNEERIQRATEGFPRTRATVLMTGWVPFADAAGVSDQIRLAAGGRCVVTIIEGANTRESPVPILVRPPEWLRPFARLLQLYGLPRYDEVDPTLFVAVGYLLMFGMMFGDVGHGLLLALAGLALRRLPRLAIARDFGMGMIAAGVVSTVFGLVYGSCFGLPAFHRHALWRDPLEGDPLALIQCALAMGVVTIGVGIGLNLINRWRVRDWFGFALDHFGILGAVFYAAGLFWILPGVASDADADRGTVFWARWLGLGLPVAGWCLRVPIERIVGGESGPETGKVGVGGAMVESAVGAFEATLMFLANTVSFVRLAAYAMSHAAILAAAFAMADQVRAIPRFGGLCALGLIIAGNLAAMVLEGLVASVQALRLQYYEFLGKFFSGEGPPFMPFQLCSPARSVTS
ncbi:MAG: hypothetical protein IT581_22295 [Verrucomicrobiales bacterium]|nr:hypothetical protein [Verrucomicrobiales bacterium]